MIKTGMHVATYNMISLILLFLVSVITINNIETKMYGVYVYLIALSAIVPVFYSAFDSLLLRFTVSESKKNQMTYMFTIIICKLAVFVIVTPIMFFYVYHFEQEIMLDETYELIFIALVFREFMRVFINSYTGIINIYEKYILLSKFAVFSAFSSLAFVFITSNLLNLESESFLFYLIVFQVVLSIIAFSFNFYIANKFIKFPLIPNQFDFNLVGQKRNLSYFLPLQLVSFQSYLKLYLPQVFLGNVTTFEDLGIFDILRKIFNIIHKIVPKVTSLFLPSFIKLKESDPSSFELKFSKYSLIYSLLMMFVGVLIIIFSDLILYIFGLESTQITAIMFILFSYETFLGAIGHTLTMYVKTLETTRLIFYSSFVRDSVGSFLTYFLILKFTAVGAVLAKLINTFVLDVIYVLGLRSYLKKDYYIKIIILFILSTIIYLLFLLKALNKV